MLRDSWPDLDEVLEIEPRRIVATRATALAEQFYEHHFPTVPIVPAVMQLSWIEHTAGVWVAHFTQGRWSAVLREIERVTCIRTITPGDLVTIDVQLTGRESPCFTPGELLGLAAVITRGEQRILRARLTMSVCRYDPALPPWSMLSEELSIATPALEEET